MALHGGGHLLHLLRGGRTGDAQLKAMLTDYHCHILPKMDDGSESVEMSIKMLEMMKLATFLSSRCLRKD